MYGARGGEAESAVWAMRGDSGGVGMWMEGGVARRDRCSGGIVGEGIYESSIYNKARESKDTTQSEQMGMRVRGRREAVRRAGDNER